MKFNRDPFAYWHLPLYYYMARTYLKFLFTRRCLDFPLSIQVQTQSRCNGRCSICPYQAVSGQLQQGIMTEDLYYKIIDEVTNEPLFAQMVFELHNEPLLDRRIFDWIKYFKSKNPGKSALIVSNGELLDQFKIEEINNSKLDSLIISLNAATRETYKKINCNLDYDRVIKNINALFENPLKNLDVILSYVVTDLNEYDVYQALKYWHKKGVGTRIMELTNRAGTVNDFNRLKPYHSLYISGFFRGLWSKVVSPLKRVIGCSLPFYQMNILYNGDVIICCSDWNRMTVLGNVLQSSLREIWNSAKTNEIRKQILNKKYNEIESCRNCSAAV